LNKELEFAMVPQNIAVISSKTAAGYGDFIDQLTKNRYGYRYHIKLYKAFMQGADTEKSIITALEHIFDSGIAYDAVIIIRGGGSQSDLNYFNSYWLAYHITQFPIPVITGIGHDRDETITDLVAHTSLKTPTAVAEFIIEKTVEFDNYLSDLYESFSDHVTNKLHDFNEYLKDIENSYISTVKLIVSNKQRALEKNKAIADLTIKSILKNRAQKIKSVTQRIKPQIHYLINIQEKEISNIKKKYKSLSRKAMLYKKHQIDEYENRAHLLDPMQLLKKGYSLTFNNGVLIKSTKQLKPGDILISKWFDGNAESSIQKISPD
jgi:exodeoxyribonuclease VII large subunit